MASPIEQFQIKTLYPLGQIGQTQIGLTNSALMMIIAVSFIIVGFLFATRKAQIIPGRAQTLAEMLYEFVGNMLREASGPEGMRFFPLVFSLFLFVLVTNLLGMVPGAFTVTSHVIVTFALALLVIGTVVVYGFFKHGIKFIGLFAPSGVPVWLLPFIFLIELTSFLSRPISLSLRLFANMLAGHIALKVFGLFVVQLAAAGAVYAIIAPLPLFMAVALTALEFLVAVLQAYIFTVLACIYLNDALHPNH